MSYERTFYDGKYTVKWSEQSGLEFLRHGEAWPAADVYKHSNMIRSMLSEACEQDELIATLRQRVTELEGQCAAMRGALEKAEYEAQSFVTAFERGQIQNRHRDGSKAALEAIRKALQSNAGAKVAAVIAAARELDSLKGMKDEIVSRGMLSKMLGGDDKRIALEREYNERKPAAWAALRESLAGLDKEE